MNELSDYSRQLIPDLKTGDFSADTLAELLLLYAKLYVALDGFWYLSVMEKFDNQEAFASDMQVWERACKYEMNNITKQLNIQGSDVVSFMKAVQMTPWYVASKGKVEIKSNNYAILTVTYCPMLIAVEKEGKGREYELCRVISPEIFRYYADFFDRDIRVRGLKLPPRNNKNGICCQWEFSLD